MSDPYRYVGEKLLEPAGPDLWPLAVLYFDPHTRGLKVALASQGAELVVGHGRKIGVIIEAQARQLCQQSKSSQRLSSGGVATLSPAPLSPPPSADDVER